MTISFKDLFEPFEITTKEIEKETGVAQRKIIEILKTHNFRDYGPIKRYKNKCMVINQAHYLVLLTNLSYFSEKADEILNRLFQKPLNEKKEMIFELLKKYYPEDLKRIMAFRDFGFYMFIISKYLDEFMTEPNNPPFEKFENLDDDAENW